MVLCTDEDECARVGEREPAMWAIMQCEALKHALARVRRYGSAAGQSVHIMATNAPCATYNEYACMWRYNGDGWMGDRGMSTEHCRCL